MFDGSSITSPPTKSAGIAERSTWTTRSVENGFMSELAATPTWRADTKRLLEASATAWSCFEPAADGSSGIQNPTERLFNDTVSWFGRRSTAVWATILLDFLPCAGGDGMGEGGGRGNGAESGGEDGGEASRDGSISELQSCAGGLSCSSSPISIRARLGCTFVPIGVPQDERQGLAVLTPTDSVRAAVPESAARNETLTNPRLAAVCWPSLRPFTSGELRCAPPTASGGTPRSRCDAAAAPPSCCAVTPTVTGASSRTD
mmetsp:Transcript_72243/g.217145  ORF Transcript_72243/g.217145 Transcript_72243/m.217145 type:complete len:260 (-) Transcript_72243:2221-3000(-)